MDYLLKLLHFSVVLCANGETYTWGSNSYGQLGVGDLISRGSPIMVRLPPNVRVTQIAAGSNHTIFLTSNGQIYTCGDFQVSLEHWFPKWFVPPLGGSEVKGHSRGAAG